jgi:hypothetical protein
VSPLVLRVQLQDAAEQSQALLAGGSQPGQPKQSDGVIRIKGAGRLKTAASLGVVPGVLRY